MMTWSEKRRLWTVFTGFCIVLVFVLLYYFLNIYVPPSCTDGVQNQKEEGPDCGGPCQIVCDSAVRPPIVMWNRIFKNAHGVFNAVAYIENPNREYGNREARYSFKLYDENNIFVTEQTGTAYIGPNEQFAIFDARIPVGEREPTRVFFKFTGFSPWIKMVPPEVKLTVRDAKVENVGSLPRATATLVNSTVSDIRDVSVVAIVYDENDNAIASSATEVDLVRADDTYDIAFTWGAPLWGTPSRVEIIPRINPFKFAR